MCGTEILIEEDGALLRPLSVHLKSGCAGGSLEPATQPACATLAAQRAPLEAWSDQAPGETVPFAILGDFNRRPDRFGQNDHLWGEIDDGDPSGLNLWRLPFNAESGCNSGFDEPMDFLVFDERAGRGVNRGSFTEVIYDADDWDPARRTRSDRCSDRPGIAHARIFDEPAHH